MLKPVVHRGRDTTHKTLETRCNARAWSQQCWKSCANGSNIVALRFGDYGTKECCDLFAQKFNEFQTLHKNSQQHPKTCSGVCKRTQPVTLSNVGSCWPTMLGPFSQSKGQEHSWTYCLFFYCLFCGLDSHLSMYCFTLLSSPSFVWWYKLSSVLDSIPWHKGRPGYPYPLYSEIRKRGRSTKFFMALRASVLSKTKGGPGPLLNPPLEHEVHSFMNIYIFC